MQRYFEQLMEDIYQSYKDLQKNTEFTIYPTELVVRDVPENFARLPCYPAKPIYKWMKLDADAFPPAEKWESAQLHRICAALRQLFEEYNYDLDIPWSLSPKDEYPFLIQALRVVEMCNAMERDEISPVQIEICKDDPLTCPFKDDCLHLGTHCDFLRNLPQWEKYVY